MRPTSDPLDRLRKILDLAESDPARFRVECERVARKLGISVEELYQLSQDPRLKEKLKDAAILGAAKLARRALGLR